MGALVLALVVALSACGAGDPTDSDEYREVVTQRDEARARRDELAAELRAVEQHVMTLEADVRDLREQVDGARAELKLARAARDEAAAERDAALRVVDGARAGSGPSRPDSRNDGVLTSEEAEDVLDDVGFVRYLLDAASLRRIGGSLCVAAASSADAVELTDNVTDSFGTAVASALGGDDAVRRFVAVLGGKMCADDLTRLGLDAG